MLEHFSLLDLVLVLEKYEDLDELGRVFGVFFEREREPRFWEGESEIVGWYFVASNMEDILVDKY